MAKKDQVAAEKVETENAESLTKKEIKECKIKVTRDNFTMSTPGLYMYTHEGEVSECKHAEAFKCMQSKNYGVRKGDVVLCKNAKEAVLIVVQ